MIVWLNGTHGAGRTTTSALVQQLIPGFTGVRHRKGRRDTHGHHAGAARTWLHGEAEVVDTTHLTPAQAAPQIAEAVKG